MKKKSLLQAAGFSEERIPLTREDIARSEALLNTADLIIKKAKRSPRFRAALRGAGHNLPEGGKIVLDKLERITYAWGTYAYGYIIRKVGDKLIKETINGSLIIGREEVTEIK